MPRSKALAVPPPVKFDGPGYGPVILRKPADLIAYANNPRVHDVAQVELLKRSMLEFGFTDPILVDESGEIIGGHGRILAAVALNIAEVPTQQVSGWSEAKKRAYRILENKAVERGGWRDDLLAGEAQWLEADGYDLELTGFSTEELRALYGEPEEDPEVKNERAEKCPALPIEPTTVAGDLWILGSHRVLCGDSTERRSVERLMDGESENAIVTDPPYGVGVDYGTFQDSRENVAKLVDRVMGRILSAPCAVLTPGIPSMWLYPQPVWMMAWVHPAPSGGCPWGFAGVNPILAYGKDPYLAAGLGRRPDSVVLASGREGVEGHPTPKPIKVWRWLVDRVMPKQGGIVLDLFGGSGSTVIACQDLKHSCRAMELGPQYCDVIVQRWQEYTGQVATLDGDGRTFQQVQAERARLPQLV